MQQDIRWLQRFENYVKATQQLTEFIEKGELNKFEKQGLIQCFEYSYELAWRTMKDYLAYQGYYEVKGSRDAVRQAFNIGLLADGQVWINMIDDRILSVHTYDEDVAEELINKIYQIYYPVFIEFKQKMETLCE